MAEKAEEATTNRAVAGEPEAESSVEKSGGAAPAARSAVAAATAGDDAAKATTSRSKTASRPWSRDVHALHLFAVCPFMSILLPRSEALLPMSYTTSSASASL
mmetsp:Transcript_391/g.701  ORF Transcript_391/g.701 Transcript_391/m.701 type:complete len:103 (+) Transcript_391:23-331(+)